LKSGLCIVFAVVVLATSSSPALAHHGTAGYDMDKTITLEGTLTSFDWSKPRCVIYFVRF